MGGGDVGRGRGRGRGAGGTVCVVGVLGGGENVRVLI